MRQLEMAYSWVLNVIYREYCLLLTTETFVSLLMNQVLKDSTSEFLRRLFVITTYIIIIILSFSCIVQVDNFY